MQNLGSTLATGLRLVSAAALILLMLFVVINIVGRSLFGWPVRGSTELNELLLGVLIFFGYPVLALQERNIRVDLLPLGPKLERFQRFITNAIGVVVFCAIGWRMWEQSARVALYGDRTPMLGVPKWIVLSGISALSFLTAIAFLVVAVRVLRGQSASPTESPST